MTTRSKDIARILAHVDRLPGWRVEDRRGGYRVFPPGDTTPMSVPHGPRTPYRAVRNLRARLRRAGARLP